MEQKRGAYSQGAVIRPQNDFTMPSGGFITPLLRLPTVLIMNSMKLVIPLHSLYWSIHTKDESKRGTAFAFIFGVN